MKKGRCPIDRRKKKFVVIEKLERATSTQTIVPDTQNANTSRSRHEGGVVDVNEGIVSRPLEEPPLTEMDDERGQRVHNEPSLSRDVEGSRASAPLVLYRY